MSGRDSWKEREMEGQRGWRDEKKDKERKGELEQVFSGIFLFVTLAHLEKVHSNRFSSKMSYVRY